MDFFDDDFDTGAQNDGFSDDFADDFADDFSDDFSNGDNPQPESAARPKFNRAVRMPEPINLSSDAPIQEPVVQQFTPMPDIPPERQ